MSRALAETLPMGGHTPAATNAVMPSRYPFDFGGYRILGLLGRGGMGTVYEAEHKDSGRRVALKVLGHGMDTEDLRKRFLREGRLAAGVSHPNSIYIFGTEEIEGAPVIVMEIAGGGTLKDELKKRGPLPAREAVDAMLQIIAGLEAAHAGGVLHRDVKPANCFLAPDGTAKVGDFGLSVSTLARQDTQITASGVLLGTPSFAPPEQLRGDDLDVRADIYSAGATLYMLLTGHAPFEGDGAVQVVAAVLDKTPKPMASFRDDLPAGLEQVVARCMAKKREERFPSYASLRDALLPFSSHMPLPAPLGLRFLASMVDELLIQLPETIFGHILTLSLVDTFLTERTLASFLPWFAVVSGWVAYYTVCEGWWGAGLGKALCGLRVIAPAGSAPGLRRAFVRSLCWVLALNLPYIVLFSLSTEDYRTWIVEGNASLPLLLGFLALFSIGWLALFTTMRERNGYATVHDLISGTRVVLRSTSPARPRLESTATPLPSEHAERVGPYRLGQVIDGGWHLGYDEVLRRQVWIARHDEGRLSVPEARRAVCRATRLRWIGGGEMAGASWDAFEALQGRPLSALPPRSQGWVAVRHWLQDLALELDAAEKDGTLPASLSLDHIWLTTDGRAVLLDTPLTTNRQPQTFEVGSPGGAQHFLHVVAGQVLDPVTVPLQERDLLQKLAAGRFDRLSFIAGNLQSLLARPAQISRYRRAASLLLTPALLAGFYLLAVGSLHYEERQADAYWQKRSPELPPLSQVMRLMTVTNPDEVPLIAWRKDEELHQAAQVHVAGHYRSFVQQMSTTPLQEDEDPEMPLIAEEREYLRTVIQIQPEPSPEALAKADARLSAELPVFIEQERRRPWLVELQGVVGMAWAIAMIQGLSLLVFGSSLGQRLFGFAVVNRKGEAAGRVRLLARWCLGWLPLLVIIINGGLYRQPTPLQLVLAGICAVIWLAGIVASILWPRRGVQDLLVRTWLVPR